MPSYFNKKKGTLYLKIIVLNVTRIGQNKTWNYGEKTFGLEMSDDTPICTYSHRYIKKIIKYE